ncbi:MAG: type III pantothenate kinase [Christensenellaceae bacterium]|jgi:type III pantothenate kinase|nr:type III pantothenate kinase [Christensenellaceae bacterium]
MILTMDIGNTNTKCAVFDGNEFLCAWRVSSDRIKTSDEYGIQMRSFLTYNGLSFGDVTGIIVSSVVPSLNFTIEHMLRDFFDVQPILVAPGIKTGNNIKYDSPQSLGSDRICNAVAAGALYGGPCIFIDFGTATSFGVLSAKGDFLGGAITPGINVTSEALAERAAQLPKIELIKPETVIQRSTIANMQAGIVYGYVGQVDYIVRKMKAELDSDGIRVIATGGLANVVAGETPIIDIIDSRLTLKGLKILYDRNAP